MDESFDVVAVLAPSYCLRTIRCCVISTHLDGILFSRDFRNFRYDVMLAIGQKTFR